MRRRSPIAALAASPTMVGAITTLIVIVAVFLAYNANNGLPFVPVYRVSVEVPDAARLGNNNEIRIGGSRVGVVESIEPIALSEQTQTAQTTGEEPAAPAAANVAPVGARLNLKLDKTAQPLPKDSVFRVRYRSSFGLKYLEIVRGVGDDAPEGFVFDGNNDAPPGTDFVSCKSPVGAEGSAESLPSEAQDGCFQSQTEFDAISNTFDAKTREAGRRNLVGFGNAFAGRGMSLNDAIEGLNPLFTNLRPVSRLLADPDTGLRRFFAELADTARIVAPVSEQQAQFFANAAVAFAALSRDPLALQETISEGPETLRTLIDTLPRQRIFLAEFAELASRLRPGVRDLQVALPSLNSAIRVGTPVLNRSVRAARDLRGVFIELRRLIDQPTTKLSLVRLRETFDEANPLLEWVVPAQTVCNYFNYWFTYLPESLSDRDQVGFNFRQTLVNAPNAEFGDNPVNAYAGNNASAISGPLPNPLQTGVFKPKELPILHGNPYAPTGQDGDDCQPGQTGYILGTGPGLSVPSQPASNPAVGVSDIPGSRGVTDLYFNSDGARVLRDTRVNSRQPD